MKHSYSSATPPIDKALRRDMDAACRRLHDKLLGTDPQSLGISEYNQRYLTSKLAGIKAILQRYSYLLCLALSETPTPVSRFAFVDYGGGSGVLSLLAKEIGVGTVVYNDIYDVSCDDVRLLSKALNLGLDHIVCGDIDALISYRRANSLVVNAIASYDVIEHIYDIPDFMRKMALLSSHPFRVVHASGANMDNPLIVYLVKKKQREFEHRDREKRRGWKERDTLRSFLEVRKEMIASYAPELSASKVEELARLTRGLKKSDIEKCVDEYREKGKTTYRPEHPTNTCDPYTGNWTEHLMDTRWLADILRGAGFSVRVLNGYWEPSGPPHMRVAKRLMNTAISLLGRKASFVSPYYVLCADYAATQDARAGG
jgi:hypothetical protein